MRPGPLLLLAIVVAWLQTLATTTARGASWRFERVDTTVTGSVVSAIAIDSHGWPHIAYYDPGPGAIRYGSRGISGWTTEFVDSTGALSQGVTRSVSLILDGNDVPHIGYLMRPSTANFNYVFRHATRGLASWNIETVFAPGATLDGPVLVQD